MKARYTVVFERDEDGWIVASIPTLGVAAQGRTRKSAEKALGEAVDSYLLASRAHGWAIPRESEETVSRLDITLPR